MKLEPCIGKHAWDDDDKPDDVTVEDKDYESVTKRRSCKVFRVQDPNAKCVLSKPCAMSSSQLGRCPLPVGKKTTAPPSAKSGVSKAHFHWPKPPCHPLPSTLSLAPPARVLSKTLEAWVGKYDWAHDGKTPNGTVELRSDLVLQTNFSAHDGKWFACEENDGNDRITIEWRNN